MKTLFIHWCNNIKKIGNRWRVLLRREGTQLFRARTDLKFILLYFPNYIPSCREQRMRAIVKLRSVIAVTKTLLLSRSEILVRSCNSSCRKKIAICFTAPRDTYIPGVLLVNLSF